MGKKYSIHMQDDQLDYVEVDGLRYRSPADIPDPRDRAKIEAMLTPGAQDEPGSALEQQFLREVRGLRRQLSIPSKLTLFIFLGVAAILLVVGVFSTAGVLQQLAREESASGKVVGLMERPALDSDTGELIFYSYPIVRFSPGGGTPVTVESSDGSSPPAYAVGDAVTVLYDVQNPRQARIKSFSSSLLLWLLPIITFVVGGSFAAVALIMFRVWPPASRED